MGLLGIQPHKVSRDLRGYSILFYGDPKTGKTTMATKFNKHLLMAFEKGYNAIPGAMANPINKWSEFRKALIELKDEEVKKTYETIIIDTADIAYDYCEKYICQNATPAVDSVADIPFGKGYNLVAKEFDECLRTIVQLGYGLVLISHATDKTFTDAAGKEFNQIVPTLGNKPRNICNRLCDIIGYSRGIETENGLQTKLFIRGTQRFVAGSRFKYTPDVIDFSYQNLVKAIGEAIDKQIAEDGTEYFTEERSNLFTLQEKELDYDALMAEFDSLIASIPGSKATGEDAKVGEGLVFYEFWAPRITQIVESYLGKGKSVKKTNRDQGEAIDLIVDGLKRLIAENTVASV